MKKPLAFLLAVVLLASVPCGAARAANASEYKQQFSYYVDGASKAGYIPSFGGGLDDALSEGDFLDFMLLFSKLKGGIDVDAYLSRARLSSPTEERAKVAALNEMFGDEFWVITRDGELDTKLALYDAIGAFSYVAYREVAAFSPLLYHDTQSTHDVRFNFWNLTSPVYSEDILIGLMGEIVGLSQGEQRGALSPEQTITRRQFAAFVYMFSTMSVPRDLSGKYPGGVTGIKKADDFIENILDKSIKAGMTDNQKVKAVYDYLIYNFVHEASTVPLVATTWEKANPLSFSVDFMKPIMENGKGTCDAFANTFKLTAIRLGFECNYVSGYYVNASSGTKLGHGWNQIKVDGVWYWLDVDVEGTVYRREKYSEPLYFLFMKKDSEWLSNHDWVRDEWPAADGTKNAVDLSALINPNPPLVPVKPKDPTATPTSSAVLVNGVPVAFDAYEIRDNNYFKLRDLAYILSGTEKQFEVGFDGAADAIALTSGAAYTAVGGEMASKGAGNKTATPTTSKIYLDGREIKLTAYHIDGNNYFKLRDIGAAFDFGVDWDGARDTIVIDTAKGYTAP
ncbi:MAG: hypothetical protein LBN30_02410 [Oscillospiraceae bacterium]|jgi:hypothetical protein|nr:hypothetical protein [Oscillospiraceae bacterium]